MNRNSVLQRLDHHQLGILSIIAEADALLEGAAPRDVAGIARARWALVRASFAYQQFKHREIFNPAIASDLLGEAQRGERMKRACLAVADAFRNHVTRWNGADVAGQWPEYQPAAQAMMARLRAHIVKERSEVEALLGGAA